MRSQDHDVNLGREYAAESHNCANDDGQAQEHLLNLEFEKKERFMRTLLDFGTLTSHKYSHSSL